MIRLILALLFAILYLIIGIPVLGVEWIIAKFNKQAADLGQAKRSAAKKSIVKRTSVFQKTYLLFFLFVCIPASSSVPPGTAFLLLYHYMPAYLSIFLIYELFFSSPTLIMR